VIHDYAGYAFSIQLSRWLARQGHTVLHVYSKDIEAPQGLLVHTPDDPPTLTLEGITTGRPLPKYRLVRRWFQELQYGAELGRRVVRFQPDIVLSANAPPAVQDRLAKALRRVAVPLLCWVQDIFSLGVAEILKSKPAPLRWVILRFLESVEFSTMRNSAGLIVISSDFLPVLARKGIRHSRSIVVENWAPLEDLPMQPKANPWSQAQGLADRFVFLCAGTLGLKHNPVHLANLARAFRDDPETRVVVISQGPGRAYLEAIKAAEGLDGLILMDYQPFKRLSDVLASADVSVLLLEDFAGVFSVPSKVYSYLCVSRPVLAAIPPDNLACRIVERERAGVCVAPRDQDGFVTAARRLRHDPALRGRLIENQARYAAQTFDINNIGTRFMAIIEDVCAERDEAGGGCSGGA
jgi:glycosyltransferase involved in cell wall biosynthesis